MPILKREFYFLRHAQTTYTAEQLATNADVSINENGHQQAHHIVDVISQLPIKTVFHSPLTRAKETKDIVTRHLDCPHAEINDLRECSGAVWNEMIQWIESPHLPLSAAVQNFLTQTILGINQALVNQGPALVIAHGGIYSALCYHMAFKSEMKIDNCIPVRFYFSEGAQWQREIFRSGEQNEQKA
jgi:broad specificity phosphatase PhoE